ncbi:hypothetical protein [Shewanella gaetbuli]|uniref:Uncharacterized protein n=1 Tax=Shewanella gaetbuli TaxID=220752 RepID=A0A9X1ZNZ6_9GAMM|nr:hypothetical protein [Shewanella gaetbuli]MCL1142945.1 hypothetical protein [Shewanella gaetbuli]
MSKNTKTEIATVNANLTAYAGDLSERQGAVGLGSENVSADDLAIPRLKLLQAISDEVQMGHPKQVEGATAGMIINNLTEELSNSIFVVNLHFTKKVVVWRKRKAGGGIYDTFDTEQEARVALQEAGEDEKNFDISENPTHLVLIIDPETGAPKGVALLDMPGTKIKVSKRWNSMIAEAEAKGHPRFGCVWQLGVKGESNTQGSYFNFDLLDITDGAKYIAAPQEIYDAATAAFESFFPSARVDEAA